MCGETTTSRKKKVQSILTLPRAPARVTSTDAPGSTQNEERGLNMTGQVVRTGQRVEIGYKGGAASLRMTGRQVLIQERRETAVVSAAK